MAGVRNYEKSSFVENGLCRHCGQKATSSPKDCKSKEHKDFYMKRQARTNERRAKA
jgi:hypothetical protein